MKRTIPSSGSRMHEVRQVDVKGGDRMPGFADERAHAGVVIVRIDGHGQRAQTTAVNDVSERVQQSRGVPGDDEVWDDDRVRVGVERWWESAIFQRHAFKLDSIDGDNIREHAEESECGVALQLEVL